MIIFVGTTKELVNLTKVHIWFRFIIQQVLGKYNTLKVEKEGE